jgi:hypothetical protein
MKPRSAREEREDQYQGHLVELQQQRSTATHVLLSRLGCILSLDELLCSTLGGVVVNASETLLDEKKGDVLAVEEELCVTREIHGQCVVQEEQVQRSEAHLADKSSALVGSLDENLNITLQRLPRDKTSCLDSVGLALLGGVASSTGAANVGEDESELGVLLRDKDLFKDERDEKSAS